MPKKIKRIPHYLAAFVRRCKTLSVEFAKSKPGHFAFGWPYRAALLSLYLSHLFWTMPVLLGFAFGLAVCLSAFSRLDRHAWSLSRVIAETWGPIGVVLYALDLRWWLGLIAVVPAIPAVIIANKQHRLRVKLDHDVMTIEDLGEDLEGMGAGFRKVKITLMHTHGKKTFMTEDELVVPANLQGIGLAFNQDDEDNWP